jgi:predicted transcriptional regulator
MPRRYHGQRKEDVFEAICRLGETLSTPPTQRQIADDLGLPPQYVSLLMMQLELEGRIEWLTRYTYRVIDAEWQSPE